MLHLLKPPSKDVSQPAAPEKSSCQDTSVGSKQLPDPASSVHTLGQNKKRQADSEVESEQSGNESQEEGLAEKKKRNPKSKRKKQ